MEQKHFQTLRALNQSGYTADVVHKLNSDSCQSAQRWSDKSIMTDLTSPNRLPIGWREDGLSTLTRLRIYELRDAMERAGLNSNYWFVSNQLTRALSRSRLPISLRRSCFHSRRKEAVQ